MKPSKKAVASIVYMIIIGFLLFLMVSCAIGNGLIKAFKSYKGSEDSTRELVSALNEISTQGSNIKLKLVPMNLEDGAAIYIFNGNSDLIEYVNDGSQTKRVIERPAECTGTSASTCLCLCEGVSLEESPNKDALSTKHSVLPKNAYSLKCSKDIQCQYLENVKYEDRIQLSYIYTDMNSVEIDRITKGSNYVNIWEGGFSIWRFQSKNKQYMFDQFARSKLLDLYAVKMFGNKVKICVEPDCITNI